MRQIRQHLLALWTTVLRVLLLVGYVGTGLWAVAAASLEGFAVGLGDSFQARRLPPGHVLAESWAGRIVDSAGNQAARAARWGQPGLSVHRRRAQHADAAISARLR